ncbi:hypothetical protein [Pseudodesulfovibrio indicus]|uniref:hypothetical protein n=1 Tax=Pseudodesulfovibrio indicus TaxID=1716143 RepID=UPI00292D4B17|nr:hypothetical protein [Pseudodesulfovibrio indicus]
MKVLYDYHDIFDRIEYIDEVTPVNGASGQILTTVGYIYDSLARLETQYVSSGGQSRASNYYYDSGYDRVSGTEAPDGSCTYTEYDYLSRPYVSIYNHYSPWGANQMDYGSVAEQYDYNINGEVTGIWRKYGGNGVSLYDSTGAKEVEIYRDWAGRPASICNLIDESSLESSWNSFGMLALEEHIDHEGIKLSSVYL